MQLVTEQVEELIAIGAAIASNCEACFRFHYDKARRLRVSNEDMYRAVQIAQQVKESPARSVLALAERYLRQPAPAPTNLATSDAGETSCGCTTAPDAGIELTPAQPACGCETTQEEMAPSSSPACC